MMPTALFESCTSSAIALPGSSSSVTQSKTRQKLHGWTVASHGKFALQKSCAGLHMSEWFQKVIWKWPRMDCIAFVSFMALHAFLFKFCQTVFLQDSQTVCSVSCSKLRSSAARSFRPGNTSRFRYQRIWRNGKYLWLCSTLAHMVGSQSLVSPTNCPSSRKSNLLSCCTWCTAFARLAWPTPTFQNLNILCHQPWATLPNMPTPNYFLALYLTCFPIFEWQGQRLLLQRELWTSFWYSPCIGAMVVWHVQISHVGLAFISEASNVESQHYSTL